MTLREKRVEFTKCLAQLLTWAFEQGYHVCFDKDGMNHMKGSLHWMGLAKDLILYSKEGEYLTHDDDYRPLGEYWKSLNPLAAWGGDSPGDGGHFSFRHEGVK